MSRTEFQFLPPEVGIVWEHWSSIGNELGLDPHSQASFAQEVFVHYSTDRPYHNVLHIAEMLQFAEKFKGEAKNYSALQLAVIGHDLVYKGVHGEDEEQSAQGFGKMLEDQQVDPGLVSEVQRLIRVTADHTTGPEDVDGLLLIDADFAILASDPERYIEYSEGIRKEYSHLEPSIFAKGRIGVLQGFIDREKLYSHPVVRGELQEKARDNMRAEIKRLQAFL